MFAWLRLIELPRKANRCRNLPISQSSPRKYNPHHESNYVTTPFTIHALSTHLSVRLDLSTRFFRLHLKDYLLHLPRLEILIRLRGILERHRLSTQESDLLLLLHEKFESVLENAADGTAAECHSDVLSVEEEAVDFPLFGAE